MLYLIIISAFVIRAVPRLLRKNAIPSDTYFHLYCARIIRENGLKIPPKFSNIILNHEYTYPYLYHLFLAMFPPRAAAWIERLTGAIFDTFSILMVYFFSCWLVGSDKALQFQDLPIWATVLFAFSPSLLRDGWGPRVFSGSPRVPSQTLYLLHLLTAYLAFITGHPLALVLSIVAVVLLSVTSKFGNQVLCFFGIFIGCLFSYHYFFLLSGSLLVAIPLTRGRVLAVLKGQIRHSSFYLRYLQQVFIYPQIIKVEVYFSRLVRAVSNVYRFQVSDFILWYFNERYFLHLLMTVNPQFFGVLGFWKSFTSHPEKFLFAWAIAGFICFLLTKTKKLLFLGEGERYLEFAAFPSIFLLSKYLLEHNVRVILYFGLGYSLIFACFVFLKFLRETPKNICSNEMIFSTLDKLPSGVIWPIGSFAWQTCYRSNFPILTHGCNVDETMLSVDEFMLVYGNYPYPSGEWENIISKYKVCYIVSDPTALDYYLKSYANAPDEFFQRFETISQNDSLLILKIIS